MFTFPVRKRHSFGINYIATGGFSAFIRMMSQNVEANYFFRKEKYFSFSFLHSDMVSQASQPDISKLRMRACVRRFLVFTHIFAYVS